MAEERFEEAKENNEENKIKNKHRLFIEDESKDLGEEKENRAWYNEADGRESGSDQGGGTEEERERGKSEDTELRKDKNKKKKKKKKDGKKLLMAAFWKQLTYKAAQAMLPIEEYFLAGDCLPLTKKNGYSLLFRIVQTHFKAKDYDTYRSGEEVTRSDAPKVSEENKKFYERRYFLFSKYDLGIKLDEESINGNLIKHRLVLSHPGRNSWVHSQEMQVQLHS